MFAYEIPNLRFSLPAGGAVAQRRFVSAANDAAIQATASTQVIGASMNEVTAGELAKNDRIVEIAVSLWLKLQAKSRLVLLFMLMQTVKQPLPVLLWLV